MRHSMDKNNLISRNKVGTKVPRRNQAKENQSENCCVSLDVRFEEDNHQQSRLCILHIFKEQNKLGK